ncbi:MAG: signal recognition particle protein [Erysipelotrichaceae bacterium]|nr:signal recognition particle protein [Erysipelotrichaceae bacterium]
MAFDSLSERLNKAFKNISGQGKLTDNNMEIMLKEIRIALLEADVNYRIVKDFLETVKEKSKGQEVLDSVDPGQMVVKIVHDEIITLLGESKADINFKDEGITSVMMVGLQGTGKTTSVAKIANILKNKLNKKVLLVAADIVRPAAIEQLKTLGESIDVEVFSLGSEVNAVDTSIKALEYAREKDFDTVLIDTAGRLHIDEDLMKELQNINESIKADEILLSVDAMTGQDIVNVAKSFSEQLPITGLVVTKFDGDSRGGGVLSVRSITQVPIKFVGQGEKIEDMDMFYPERMADRILGMGDIVSFVEHAQEKMDMEEAEKSAQRMLEGTFTMNDMLFQLEQTTKLGPLSGVMKMLPGMSNFANQFNDEDANKQLSKTKAIIQSMTKAERNDPSILRSSHKRRIAKGSGTSINEVNKLINQYGKMQQMFKQIGSIQKKGGFDENTLNKMMNQMQGKVPTQKRKWKF